MAKRKLKNKDLRPCPFCGGSVRAVITGDEAYGLFWMITRGVGKDSCNCRVFMESGLFGTAGTEESEAEYDKLVETWNRRGNIDE